MPIFKKHYTEQEALVALESADVETAIALWKAKDWVTYEAMRDVLLGFLRAGCSDLITTRHIQFIYFVQTHLQTYRHGVESDRQIFMADPATKTCICAARWDFASSGAFFKELL